MKFFYFLMSISLLASCGGGGGQDKDSTSPTISGVSASAPSNGQITLTASATDNQGVSGYCFKTNSSTPAASDSCFGSTALKIIDAPTSPNSYYVWVKDAANNVSTPFTLNVPFPVDTNVPTISGVTASAPSNGQITLTASATDNQGVSGYCFKTDSSTPAASDSCFGSTALKIIDAPTSPNSYYVWVKDAANNVSTPFTLNVPFPVDTSVPTISGVTASVPSNGQITLTASATDNQGVSGYCFKTTSTAPAASDSCFTAAASKTIATPTTPTRYYTWAKDAANNISSAFNRVAGSCSTAGVTASLTSSLPTVCVSTSLGEFVLELEASKAPVTTTNFLKYVNDGYFSQTVFHRVISNFMIQGGGFTAVPISSSNAKTGTTYPAIALETTATTGLSNTAGTIAMARTPVLNSATHEFFINVVDNVFLNTNGGGYAVFGRVISGLNPTVQSIRNVSVQANGSGEISQPLTPPVINWAYQLQ